MQTNCTLLAKVVVNKRLETIRVVFTFDRHNKLTVRNAVMVTGDLCDMLDENADYYVQKAMEQAKQTLRCANVEIVE